MPGFEGRLYESLRQAGLPDVPESFSIAVVHQEISRAIVTEIERFIRVFDRITTRPVWQEAVTATAPPIARGKRSEVCFFSAWDFHLPPERPERWQLIECNDNGSGLLFAALLNRLYYEVSGIGERRAMEAPMPFSAFSQRVTDLIRTEAEAFFGAPRAGLVLILDDEDSVRRGRFRHELVLLRDVCRRAGCHSEVASPVDTTWDGSSLLCGGERVSFVVNRSTDFFWEAPVFAPLRAAYAAGGVYVAPNPFSYATRSDKGLLERLGSPVGDADSGDPARRETPSERPRARDAATATRQRRGACARQGAVVLQALPRVREPRRAHGRAGRSRASASTPEERRFVRRATAGCEVSPGFQRRRTSVGGPPGLGLPRRATAFVGPSLPSCRHDGPVAARGLAADLRANVDALLRPVRQRDEKDSVPLADNTSSLANPPRRAALAWPSRRRKP